jgi:hypothetical protein
MPGEGERQKHHRDNPPMMIGRPGPDDMPRGPRPVRVKDFQPNPGDEASPKSASASTNCWVRRISNRCV